MRSQILIHPEELSKNWIDRIADAGVTVLGIHPWGGKHAEKSIQQMSEFLKTPEYRGFLDYAAERGLEIEYEIHAAGYLLPRDLFETHPEYFRMNENGERTPDWNFCVSDPKALSFVAKRAAELALTLYRSGKRFYFWMDDGKDVHCRCPRCRDLSPSDQQLLVINAMLSEIKKHISDAKMAYLAYFDSLSLPEMIKASPDVFLEYAPMEKYVAKSEDAPQRIAREQAMIGPLMDFFGREDAKVLEYWYDNSLYSKWKKPPKEFHVDREAMAKDIDQYKALGFSCISTFGCFLGADYEELFGAPDIVPFAELTK